MLPRRRLRLLFLIVLLGSAAVVSFSWLTYGTPGDAYYQEQYQLPYEERAQVTPPANGTTVVTGQPDILRTTKGSIVAFDSAGRVKYYNESNDSYLDVDPSPSGAESVVYVAQVHFPGSECDAPEQCTRNIIERANLSTGRVTTLYSYVQPAFETGGGSNEHTERWHDIDRIDSHRFLIGDIHRDSVYIVNTTSETVGFEWRAQDDYPLSSGGQFFNDWTHLNDVEWLGDGRLMVSLRNHDQVVFIDTDEGMLQNWTLGADDNHDILYEQHNPDYIPSERGGPAVLVSDSENNRIAEYQRTDGEWNRSWVWQDSRLQWPRDADRLPNGHTLIADVHGGRILETNQSGDIVWEIPFDTSYEVERLSTDDESTGGASATELNLTSRTLGTSEKGGDGPGSIKAQLKSLIPSKLLNGLLFVLPGWMRFETDIAVLGALVTVLVWTAVEARWFFEERKVSWRWPISFERRH